MAIKEVAIQMGKPIKGKPFKYKPLTSPSDFKRQNREGFPQTNDTLNTGNLKVNVTASQVNAALRIVKNVLGVDYLSRGGRFLANSIAFDLAHSVSVAKEMKIPYNLYVQDRIVKHFYLNKVLYRKIAAAVNASKT